MGWDGMVIIGHRSWTMIVQPRGVPQSYLTLKWQILHFFLHPGVLFVGPRKEHLMMVLSSSYGWYLKYQVVPETSVYPKYRVIPDVSGYPLPDDFQNWIGSGSGTRWALDRSLLEFCITWVMYQSSVAPPASPQRPNTSLQEKNSNNQTIKIPYLTSLATWQCPAHIVPQCEQKWLGWCRWQERPRALGVRVAASSKYIIKCFLDLTPGINFFLHFQWNICHKCIFCRFYEIRYLPYIPKGI